MSIEKLYNQGKMIYYIDHRGATESEVLATIEEFVLLVKDVPEKVRIIYDFSGVEMTNEILKELYYYGKDYMEERTLAAGLLGIDGVKKTLLKVFISITQAETLTVFENIEEAKSFLSYYK